MDIIEFAIMLATFLFGGHSAIHRWEARKTRRALLLRACKAPEFVARAWVERQEDGQSTALWLQFTGGKPHTLAQGKLACAEVVARLRAAGVVVDTSAVQKDALRD